MSLRKAGGRIPWRRKTMRSWQRKLSDILADQKNVNALVHCATRLRFKVKNTQNVDKEKTGAVGGCDYST